MKVCKRLGAMILALCLATAGIAVSPDTVSAKGIVSERQVKKLAKQAVKGADVVKVEKDKEKNEIVYDVELRKAKKEYDLVYRASDLKLISYKWEMKSKYVKKGKGGLIGEGKAKTLAKKQAKDAKLTSISQKRSNSIDVYKAKLKSDSRKYELKIHARTGAVLEYEWDAIAKTAGSKDKGGNGEQDSKNDADKDKKDYIGIEAAKDAAVSDAGLSFEDVRFTKAKLDCEDGIMVYEIKFCTSDYKYEYEIDALTGAVHDKEVKRCHAGSGDDIEHTGRYIGMEQAEKIALEEAGGGRIIKSKLDVDDGVAVYEVEVAEGNYEYEIKIHAETGTVLKVEREYKPYPDVPQEPDDYIGLEQAKRIALEAVGGGRVVKAEFDMEDGQPMYEIEIAEGSWEYELEIHAVTGDILKNEMEAED
ncbi:MAG: hypothetical protein HFH36_03355 [Lachnospiraceae bacterium]|nr:hypothetical protein [Lachnospiraceae bacterium]